MAEFIFALQCFMFKSLKGCFKFLTWTSKCSSPKHSQNSNPKVSNVVVLQFFRNLSKDLLQKFHFMLILRLTKPVGKESPISENNSSSRSIGTTDLTK